MTTEAGWLTQTTATENLDQIATRIAPLRARLASHPLYARIRTAAQLRTFMESHVYAVWDFMSLLKSLQSQLTCVDVPWKPTRWPESRRFINEIVLGEESDLYQGRAVSHFELYVEAMQEARADTQPILNLLGSLSSRDFAPAEIPAPAAAREFVRETFALIQSGGVHEVAAAFTFGREDIIPDLFRGLVRDLNTQLGGQFSKFLWYLERHIEVDGEDHGPLSLRMVADLCGEDETHWQQATSAAETALKARLALWDGILESLP